MTTFVAVDGPALWAFSVYVMSVPATSGSGESSFVQAQIGGGDDVYAVARLVIRMIRIRRSARHAGAVVDVLRLRRRLPDGDRRAPAGRFGAEVARDDTGEDRADAAWTGACAQDRERAVAHVCVGDDDTAGVGRPEVVDQDRARCDVAREHRHVGLAELREPEVGAILDDRRSARVVVVGIRVDDLHAPHLGGVGDADGMACARNSVGLYVHLDHDRRGRPIQHLAEVAAERSGRALGADPAIVRHELDLRRERVLYKSVGHVVRPVVRHGERVVQLVARDYRIGTVALADLQVGRRERNAGVVRVRPVGRDHDPVVQPHRIGGHVADARADVGGLSLREERREVGDIELRVVDPAHHDVRIGRRLDRLVTDELRELVWIAVRTVERYHGERKLRSPE